MLYTLHTLELYPRYIAARSHRCIKCYVPSFLFFLSSPIFESSLRKFSPRYAIQSRSNRDRVGKTIESRYIRTDALSTRRSKTRFLFIRVLLIFRRVTTKEKEKKEGKEKKNEIQRNVRVTNTSKLIFLRDRSSKKIDSKDRRDQDPTIARPKFRVNILGDYLLPSNTIEGIIN